MPDYNFLQYSNAIPAGVGGAPNVTGTAQGLLGGASALAGPASGLAKAVPILGLGLTAASTVMSIVEADKQKAAMREAQREAERKELEAERLKQQNLYAAVQVPVQAYERAYREGTAANAQAVEALAQDPRTLLGGIQGVQEATIEGQAQNTERLADRLYNKAMTDAGAGMAINQDLSKLYLDQAEGAQVAAMAAEKAMIANQQAALQGLGGLATQGMGMIGTYGGLANQGDQLQTLLGGTSFAKPATQNAQGMDPKMMQAFAQFLKTYTV
jgi:hypothetical protein